MKEDTLKTKRMWAVAALAAAAVAAVGASASSARPVAAKAPAAPAAAHKTIKVGLVTDIGGLNDKCFNFLANKGLQQAKRQLGATVEVRESKTELGLHPEPDVLRCASATTSSSPSAS